ncbi:hypothetical protein BT96DRAFT_1004621 [Gymnopus androsaceus JB14]|uniref:Alpha-1,2-Mannosidase n=1 Tax=Gymnopus androsaceus JB14 TaxID=1447944 RepID=A0A6A4GS34_9AGAR|nr:hypothetical protein BT96DRAFT_1004621 [Gymnopus androsaceus JB14]
MRCKLQYFETTIRVLGGLLLAYELTGHDKLYLGRAIELANHICFRHRIRASPTQHQSRSMKRRPRPRSSFPRQHHRGVNIATQVQTFCTLTGFVDQTASNSSPNNTSETFYGSKTSQQLRSTSSTLF